MHRQLICATTGLDRRRVNKSKLDQMLKDPHFAIRFAGIINRWGSEPWPDESLSGDILAETRIDLGPLPEPPAPGWSRGKILLNALEPQILDVATLHLSDWYHPKQLDEGPHPSGYDILSLLVGIFKKDEDSPDATYQVCTSDLINVHYGLKTLVWLEQNWTRLPAEFREWAKGKFLYAWNGLIRNEDHGIDVPALNCIHTIPQLRYLDLSRSWIDIEAALTSKVEAEAVVE